MDVIQTVYIYSIIDLYPNCGLHLVHIIQTSNRISQTWTGHTTIPSYHAQLIDAKALNLDHCRHPGGGRKWSMTPKKRYPP